MRHVWPGAPGPDLDREDLAALYAYPAELSRPFVRLNFVASADGAVSVGGVSGGLAASGDKEVFGLLRELADVVLAGSGTVRAEGYRGARTSPDLAARRRARGLTEVPPIAVVTTSADLDPASALFTDTTVPPIVLTAAEAPESARERLTAAGAVVVPVGPRRRARGATQEGRERGRLGGEHSEDDPRVVDPVAVVDALGARGLHRVLCEGGPALSGSLLEAGRVDELCLSLAPQLAGPGAGRILTGQAIDRADSAHDLRLAAVLAHENTLLLRYRTTRGDDGG